MKLSRYFRTRQNPMYLLFWPVYIFRYLLIEGIRRDGGYYDVRCPLDDRIPFLNFFIIPYILWYFCFAGVHVWLLIRNDPAYVSYCRYLMISAGISTTIFLLFPTCQNLRPGLEGQNSLLDKMVRLIYWMDTNTNVCPSEHVIGSAGFFLAVFYSENTGKGYKVFFGFLAWMSAVSTVFLKQHSVLDVLAAIPVSMVTWYFSFRRSGHVWKK